MARAASAVLTQNDKKLVVADITAKVKATKANIAALKKTAINAGKAIVAADKDAMKAIAAINKAMDANIKALSKDLATTNKAIAAEEKALTDMSDRLELIKAANVPAPKTTAAAPRATQKAAPAQQTATAA